MLLPWTCGSALHALENHQVHTLLAKMMTKIIPLEFSPGNFQLKKLPVTMFFPELVIGNSENSKLFACLVILKKKKKTGKFKKEKITITPYSSDLVFLLFRIELCSCS